MKFCLLSFFLLFACPAFSQNEGKQLLFNFTLEGKTLELGKKYYSSKLKDSLSIDVFRFYISDLQFIDNENNTTNLRHKYILLDLDNPTSLSVNPKETALAYNQVKFKLGIDSLTNVSGAMGGDLDPMHGMYWTWQSGYINFKLEGTADKCPARNHAFQFHLGGYQSPYCAVQEVQLDIKEVNGTKKINFALEDFLREINLQENYRTMSPSAEAVELSQLAAKTFRGK